MPRKGSISQTDILTNSTLMPNNIKVLHYEVPNVISLPNVCKHTMIYITILLFRITIFFIYRYCTQTSLTDRKTHKSIYIAIEDYSDHNCIHTFKCRHLRILIKLQENRFTKCDVCSMIHREMEKTRDPLRKAEVDRIRTEHNALQM